MGLRPRIRLGRDHLRAERKTLREIGLSNRVHLRVIERSCFTAKLMPLPGAQLAGTYLAEECVTHASLRAIQLARVRPAAAGSTLDELQAVISPPRFLRRNVSGI
jgi:hypothetical protein